MKDSEELRSVCSITWSTGSREYKSGLGKKKSILYKKSIFETFCLQKM